MREKTTTQNLSDNQPVFTKSQMGMLQEGFDHKLDLILESQDLMEKRLKKELRQSLKQDIKEEINTLRIEFKEDINILRVELKEDINVLRGEFKQELRSNAQTIFTYFEQKHGIKVP